ncbi:hypothetical protein VTK73DRAFT_7665 [Phialemonium thermophilum]|uniref:Protein DSF2 n=1 Tax=Phialemonium thermophilum TaxID=223376 RepID=A0ABR3Y6F7_9PEZI
MADQRPNFIDLRSHSQSSVSRPLRSPRLHVAGEVPPALSPLDAFALQSRLLAKQLEEESNKAGRRMSRLPPLTVESPLIVQARSDYFRGISQDSNSDCGEAAQSPREVGLGLKTEVENAPVNRPVSVHPRMSRIPPTPDESIPLPKPPPTESTRGREESHPEPTDSYFGARRERSPSPMDAPPVPPLSERRRPAELTLDASDARSSPQALSQEPSSFSSPEKLARSNSFDPGALAPPRSFFPKRSSSIMSSPLESADEDGSGSLSASFTSRGVVSPALCSYQRSPSISSEASGLPRPSFNFSRPLTRASTPVLEAPARQASSDSQNSFILADETVHTPISMSSEGFPDSFTDDGKSAAPSYIYSKFSLPRGKTLQRSFSMFSESLPLPTYHWEQPAVASPSNVQTYPISGQPPPSPPTRPSSSASLKVFEDPIPRPSLERSKLSMEILRAEKDVPREQIRPLMDGARDSEEIQRGRSLTSRVHDDERAKAAISAGTSDSASTIKPARSQYSNGTSISEMSAEEHVTKAIALHENGSLNESTYHLRHAARQGHPTGMLLYALACRHGWGMRPNQREGVEWLRKAAESASLEIADDEGQAKEGKSVDVVERKTRKAQFALSIYELGVSHMNGWGVEQDKALALRCFEIAGSWGDVDALAEAGFCYAQGIGCKKNLKKSAAFYRQAEAKGMSMVGNSWIHKAKYNVDNDRKNENKSEKKSRSKSRTRKNIFGLKSST